MSDMPELVPNQSYDSLVKNIRSIYERAQKVVVHAYWEIGKLIVEADLVSDHGDKLVENLSRDLSKQYGSGFSVTNLKSMRKFFVAYPKGQTSAQLDWSHYQHLCRVPDPVQRKKLETKALSNDLSSRELKKLITDEIGPELPQKGHIRDNFAFDDETRAILTLEESRGILSTYRIHQAATAKIPERLLLDLGFNIYHQITSTVRLAADDIVSYKDKTFIPVRITRGAIYTYRAYLEKVIDGDTIWVYVDLGFGEWTRQKLRLRGIDTPELTSTAGQKARVFVQNRLKDLRYLVVKTYTSDKYDRYLTDIFYLKGARSPERVAEKGTFLNQELLDEGLARFVG